MKENSERVGLLVIIHEAEPSVCPNGSGARAMNIGADV